MAPAKSTPTESLKPLLPGQEPTLAHWQALAAPFPLEVIERLPRGVQARDEDKGRCEQGTRYSADGYYCGGWHVRSIHLPYVGHAGVTDRLNSVDLGWAWEPVNMGPNGLPLIVDGGLWIRLTVLGVTRLGYGDAPAKRGDVTKELIGDAIRNAAMRFGVGTYLWSKSEAAQVLAAGGDPDAGQASQEPARKAQQGARAQAAPTGPAEHQQQVLKAFQALPPTLATWVRENWRWSNGPGQATEDEAVEMLGWMATQDRDYRERYPDLGPAPTPEGDGQTPDPQ